MTEARIDWAAHTTRLVDAAAADRDWYRTVAHGLVGPTVSVLVFMAVSSEHAIAEEHDHVHGDGCGHSPVVHGEH
ncbi:hypothetical protein ABIH81_20255 [Micromonospora sp. HUAS YX12]|uniref:Uncharacterized protein n=1 Tax=Micromonospora sp. HUAS YX12 TaxID=3156396 RepID=A0AAU7QVK8_9ACTN